MVLAGDFVPAGTSLVTPVLVYRKWQHWYQ